MTISGGRTKQLDIFYHVTGFTSDFLSFIVVELVRFFHGAIQFCDIAALTEVCALLRAIQVIVVVHAIIFYGLVRIGWVAAAIC